MIVRSSLTSSTTLDVGCVYADQVNPLTPAYDPPPPLPPRCNQPRCSKLSRRRRLLRSSTAIRLFYFLSRIQPRIRGHRLLPPLFPTTPSLPSGYPLFRRNSRPNVEQDLLKPAQPPINPSLWADVNCSGNGETGKRCWIFFLLREMARVWFPLDSQILSLRGLYVDSILQKGGKKRRAIYYFTSWRRSLKISAVWVIYIYMKVLTVDDYLLFISRFFFSLIIQFPTSIKSFSFHSPVSISSTDVLQFPG